MKASNLHDLWNSPDNSRLTSKQYSFRLPTHIAAKIAALCEMYPIKNRTQVVADLLTSAMDDLEQSLPQELGLPIDMEEQHRENEIAEHLGNEPEKIYHLGGAKGQFHHLANKYFKEYETELGNESPTLLFEEQYLTESVLKKD